MVFDTGAFETIIFPALAERLGVFRQEQPKLGVLSGGIGGTTPAIRTVIDSMRVGDFKSDFVPVKMIRSISNAYSGIIGLDFISDYSVRIDPVKKVVVFEDILDDQPRYGGHNEAWWRKYYTEFTFYRSAWDKRRDDLKKLFIRNSTANRSLKEAIATELASANHHYRESEKLYDRLNRFAVNHSVPMHWRRPIK